MALYNTPRRPRVLLIIALAATIPALFIILRDASLPGFSFASYDWSPLIPLVVVAGLACIFALMEGSRLGFFLILAAAVAAVGYVLYLTRGSLAIQALIAIICLPVIGALSIKYFYLTGKNPDLYKFYDQEDLDLAAGKTSLRLMNPTELFGKKKEKEAE